MVVKKTLFSLLMLFVFASTAAYAQVSPPALGNTVNAAGYLSAHGISSNELNKISEANATQLNDIATENNLTNEQVRNLFDSYLVKHKEDIESTANAYIGDYTRVPNGIVTPTDYKHDELIGTDINLIPSSPHTLLGPTTWSNLSWSANNGAEWYVGSVYGYKQATGFTTLPSVYANSSNDRPYMYFSLATNGAAVASDAGVVYYVEDSKWHAFMNLLIWNSATSSYVQYWNSSQTINISNPYINYKVTYNASYSQFDLIVIDPASWSTIATYTRKSTDNVPGSVPVNSTYSNVRVSRAVSLAQSTENLTNGSYVHNAIWSNVYIYAASANAQWTSTQTDQAGKANKAAHWATVTVNSYTPWYQDDVSIDY